jgi:uncharacterized protein with PQ loop repeat
MTIFEYLKHVVLVVKTRRRKKTSLSFISLYITILNSWLGSVYAISPIQGNL